MDANCRNKKPQEAKICPFLPRPKEGETGEYSVVVESFALARYESSHPEWQAFAPHYFGVLHAMQSPEIGTNREPADLEQSSPNYRFLDDCAK
jgi:hypothetical protein